jgi:hypothetical protein
MLDTFEKWMAQAQTSLIDTSQMRKSPTGADRCNRLSAQANSFDPE